MNTSSTCDTLPCAVSTIEIEKAAGCDTSVAFNVPVREIIPATDRDDRLPPQPKRSLRILYVDDDAQVREFMTACLRHFEHRILVASGGKQGLEMFRSATMANQPYDVVITDLGMPEINGRELARTIKAESPATPIVLMTGWGSTVNDDNDTASGVDVVVGKPPRMEELNGLLLRMASPACQAGKEEGSRQKT